MAELTTDPRQPRPALSERAARARAPGRTLSSLGRPPSEMSETGADRAALEQALQRVLTPGAVTNALRRRCGRDGTSPHYIDALSIRSLRAWSPGLAPMFVGQPGATIPPRGFATKEG